MLCFTEVSNDFLHFVYIQGQVVGFESVSHFTYSVYSDSSFLADETHHELN